MAQNGYLMSEDALITIRHSLVPEYLHASELYLSFSSEADDEISVPSACYKEDLKIESSSDLENLLLTMRFWILRRFPFELIAFLVNKFDADCETVLHTYSQEFPAVLDLVRSLHVKFHRLRNCVLACMHGRVDFLEYFVKQGDAVEVADLLVAADNGHLDCLLYAYSQLSPVTKAKKWAYFDLDKPVQKGYKDCLQFLLECGTHIPVDVSLCALAIRHNQLGCLSVLVTHLQKQNCEISHLTWITAIKNSNPCLDYLLCTYPAELLKPNLVNLACRLNNSNSLRMLIKHGSMVDNTAITEAAEAGSFECLQILHNDLGLNCWVPSTMAAAAGAGKLKLVKRLHEQGCSWDGTAIAAALRTNQHQCHHYLAQRFGKSTIF